MNITTQTLQANGERKRQRDHTDVDLDLPMYRRYEVPAYLKKKFGFTISESTLASLATRGGGPGFRKINREVFYPGAELDSWTRQKLAAAPVVRSTSEADAVRQRSVAQAA